MHFSHIVTLPWTYEIFCCLLFLSKTKKEKQTILLIHSLAFPYSFMFCPQLRSFFTQRLIVMHCGNICFYRIISPFFPSHHPYYLLIQQKILFCESSVHMHMSHKPVFIVDGASYVFQVFCQDILFVGAESQQGDDGGRW